MLAYLIAEKVPATLGTERPKSWQATTEVSERELILTGVNEQKKIESPSCNLTFPAFNNRLLEKYLFECY